MKTVCTMCLHFFFLLRTVSVSVSPICRSFHLCLSIVSTCTGWTMHPRHRLSLSDHVFVHDCPCGGTLRPEHIYRLRTWQCGARMWCHTHAVLWVHPITSTRFSKEGSNVDVYWIDLTLAAERFSPSLTLLHTAKLGMSVMFRPGWDIRTPWTTALLFPLWKSYSSNLEVSGTGTRPGSCPHTGILL